MDPSPPPPRSVVVTILGCLMLVIGAGGSVMSALAFLFMIAPSAPPSASNPFGALLVVGGPPALFLAALGLLLRKRWGHVLTVLALVGLLAANGYGILRGPTPGSTFVSASGVPTTILASEAQYSLPLILFSLSALVLLFLPSTRREFGF